MSNMEDSTNKDYLDTKIGAFHKDPSIATIYVGNLSYQKNEDEIKDMFEAFGAVNYVKIVKDQNTEQSRGIAFVQMVNRKQALYGISQLNGSQMDGRSLKVSIAVERDTDRTKVVRKKRRKPYKAYVSKKDRAVVNADMAFKA